jgi:hypothetical protein
MRIPNRSRLPVALFTRGTRRGAVARARRGSSAHPQPVGLLLHEQPEGDEACIRELVPTAGVQAGALAEAVPLRHLLAHHVEEDAVGGEHIAHDLSVQRSGRAMSAVSKKIREPAIVREDPRSNRADRVIRCVVGRQQC